MGYGGHRVSRWTCRGGSRASSARDLLTLVRVGVVYWLGIYPYVRRELASWDQRARRIPNQMLRRHATNQLAGERLNPEAAALFSVLAPRGSRRRVARLIVAYQVLYDYLDAVNEEPSLAELPCGLQLHRALTDAVLPDRAMSDYYAQHPELRGGADGGYMHGLTDACRRVVRTLPAARRSARVLANASQRCGEAQSYNHATLARDQAPLIEWSLAQAPDRCDYLWWELAAGGISCLGIHALLASAADPASNARDAASIDAAYFPAICALSSLLDSLADYHEDAGTSNHNFVLHYRDGAQAAERLATIFTDAAERVKPLRNRRLHAIILVGIASYYLSSPSLADDFPAAVAECLRRHVGALGSPMRAALRVRRRLRSKASSPSMPTTRATAYRRATLGEPAARVRARR
jgi:tetraprenyl-beta-curcumene synthase